MKDFVNIDCDKNTSHLTIYTIMDVWVWVLVRWSVGYTDMCCGSVDHMCVSGDVCVS